MHPSGSLYWPIHKTLMIADVHFGKVNHFRKHGSALPTQVGLQNFRKLDKVVNALNPEHIIFMGDLFHSVQNEDWNRFKKWVKQQRAKLTLIVGNHDVIPMYMFENLGMQVATSMDIGCLYLSHHPEEKEGFWNICGHLHPGYRLRGEGRQQLKLSCFYKKQHQLILPAFGAFTGRFLIEPEQGEEVYVLAEDEVFPVS
jgi:DNA ligase-associated metallophosphoesterase